MDDEERQLLFRFFTEIGIIAQLSSTIIEKGLPERLTNVHFGILSHLSRRAEGSTPQQMAFAFQIPKTSMTHMLRVLEDMGQIEVGPNPEDARSKLARLTPKGRAQFQSALAVAGAEFESMRPELSLDAIAAALEPLTRIRTELDAARNDQKG